MKSFGKVVLTMTALMGILMSQVVLAKVNEGDKFPLAELKKEYLTKKGSFNPNKAKAKVYIIDFWASWCEPCKKALPALDTLYKQNKKKGLVVIGINVDDEKQLGQDFLKSHGVSFPVIFDKGRALAEKIEISTMPTSYVLDKSGKVKFVHRGFVDGQEAEYAKQISEVLKN
jgi:thiol-disulfide isomerase/thioredoxin